MTFNPQHRQIPLTDLLSPRYHDHWRTTANGQPRGYIDTQGLKELWIHTGTACNLACSFCLEGSHPGDSRLEPMQLEPLMPLIDEAMGLGVEQFSFTGGEPFVIRDFIRILQYASQHRPCFVLTNATDPLWQRRHRLLALRNQPYNIRFRVSLDYPDAERHDRERGADSFIKALRGIRWLIEMGFDVSIARLSSPDEDKAQVEAAFRQIFQAHRLPIDLPFTAFPDFGAPGSEDGTPEITEACMTAFPTPQSRDHFMCAHTRMLVKRQGQIRVYACTLVDDDPDYDLGGSLRESLAQRVMLRHHRCYSCYRFGASCSAPN